MKPPMPQTQDHDCLSFGDALFLHLERPGMPLHVASLAVFEGQIEGDACARFVASKLPLIPRYRQHVVPAPLNLSLPVWQYDRAFDVRNHIREVNLRRGTMAELRTAAARILSVPLDRARPLWDMTLFRGLREDRTGMLIRVHHCLADGLSGVGLMHTLLDSEPSSPPPARKRLPPVPNGRPAQSLIESAVEACFSTVERVLTSQSELLQFAQQLVNAAAKEPEPSGEELPPGLNQNGHLPSVDEWNRLLPELLGAAERLPFNVVCYGPQKFDCAEIPLADLKQAKHLCGATLNDVVLSLITAVVQQYVRTRGVRTGARSLRIVMPVSVRTKAEAGELGNRITFVPVNIPMHPRRVRDLVAAVHRNTGLLKTAHIGELVGLAGSVLGAIPPLLQAAMGPIASQLPLSVANLICTNVPGPKQPLYLLGHKMLSCHPYVPIGGEMGLNIAVLSYDGTMYFGFTGDMQAVPDLAVLPKMLTDSFSRLQKELGLSTRSRRKRSVRRTQDRPGVTAPSAPSEPAATVPPIAFPRRASISKDAVREQGAFPTAVGA